MVTISAQYGDTVRSASPKITCMGSNMWWHCADSAYNCSSTGPQSPHCLCELRGRRRIICVFTNSVPWYEADEGAIRHRSKARPPIIRVMLPPCWSELVNFVMKVTQTSCGHFTFWTPNEITFHMNESSNYIPELSFRVKHNMFLKQRNLTLSISLRNLWITLYLCKKSYVGNKNV